MEIKLRWDGVGSYRNTGLVTLSLARLCADDLDKAVKLPKPRPRTIYAVFTTKRHTGISFKLDPSNERTGLRARLPGNPYILTGARDLIELAYNAGFRYVHIEY